MRSLLLAAALSFSLSASGYLYVISNSYTLIHASNNLSFLLSNNLFSILLKHPVTNAGSTSQAQHSAAPSRSVEKPQATGNNKSKADDVVSNVVSPEAYGAIGDGNTDDTRAIQAMFTDAINNKCKIVIPAKNYKITHTVSVVPPKGKTEFRLDVEGQGESVFRYNGNTGACLRIVGLRFSTWSGVKVGLGAAPGIVGIDLDTDAGAQSTSNISFIGCHIGLGKGVKQRGWRMGYVSGGGADISVISWDNCSVYGGFGRPIAGQIGWHNEGANTLQNVLTNCFGAFLDKLFSNATTETRNTGNGAFYFFGLGTSHNNLEFEIANAQTYLISGGRFEVGKHVLHVLNSNVAPSITFQGTEISNYDPSEPSNPHTNGCLFYLDMPCSLKLDNCNIGNGTPYDERMISGMGGGGSKTAGTLIIDGGSISANKDAFYQVGMNQTRWAAYVRGVGRLSGGVRTELMTDKAGLIPIGHHK